MRIRSGIAALGLAAFSMSAQAQSLSTEQIVELYGQADQAWGAEVSTEGNHVALGCAPLGPPAICIYDLDNGGTPQLFQIPDDVRLNGFFWISPKHILIRVEIFDTINTSSGLRDYNFDRIISYNVETKTSAILMNKEARNTVSGDLIVASLPEDDDHILMLLAHENSIWRVDLNDGDARHKETYNSLKFDYVLMQPDGTEAAFEAWDRDSGKYTIWDGKKKVLLETVNADGWPYSVYGFNQDRTALLAWADTPSEFGLKQISLEDGSVSDVEIDGRSVGAAGRILDETTQELIGVSYTDHLRHQLFIDTDLKAWHDEFKLVFPDQNVLITSYTSDKSMMTLAVQTEGKPTEYYLFDSEGPSVSPLAEGAPNLKGRTLGTVEPVTYPASDGLEIEGYLTLPPGKTRTDGPFPLILLPHGGPESRDTANFDWWAQAYAAAGYAVLQPNFRGSSGYGQTFRNAGYGEFGGKMITDSLEGADWLVEQGVAKDGGYCIVGASYGGYAALQGSVLGGDAVKCAVSVNGVSDPISQNRDASARSSAFRYWEEYMGVTRFSSDEERAAITPRENASKISSAVLLIHGEQDTTVKPGQSSAMASQMSNRANFRYVPMDGEDHNIQSTAARQTVLKESLDWLARYLPVE